MSGVFYIGLDEQLDGDKVKAYPPRSRLRFCFVRRASSHALAITPSPGSIACKEEKRRQAMRMILSVLALAASLDAAIAQQPPAANAQPPQPAFVNGALAVPGAPANTDTVPAKFSEKNAADDKLITLAYTFKTLSNEERRAIYEALRDKPASAAFNADIGAKLPANVALQPVPPGLANNVPQTKGYYYAVMQDRVLLVSPENQTVVGVFAEDKAR
jgi:hypothetical protein